MANEPFDLGPFSAKSTPPEDWLQIVVTLLFSVALIAFLGLYLYYAVAIQSDTIWTRAKETFGVILPALTGILGTVIGFYFGNRSK
jgi:hypothetical protein